MDTMRGTHWIKNKSFRESKDFTYVFEPKNVYEVIRIMNKKPLFLKEHLERMETSLHLQSMTLSKSHEEIRNLLEKLVKRNNFSEGNIKLLWNGSSPSELYLYFIPHYYPEDELYKHGIITKTLKIQRHNPNAKVVDPTYKKAVTDFIHDEQIYEALIVNQKNEITEGSKSNIFFVRDNMLITPPLKDVLGGVTRQKIIELALEHHLVVQELPFLVTDLPSLEGAFISGTSPNLLPIREIDGVILQSSSSPFILKLMDYFDESVKQEIKQDF